MFRLSDKKTGGGIFLKAHKTYFSSHKIHNYKRYDIKKLKETTRMLLESYDLVQENPLYDAGKCRYVTDKLFIPKNKVTSQ
jgi:hypothetical protein